MKRKVVFILGLSRVGSTLLDLVLGSQPRLIGLGEVYDTLQLDWEDENWKQTCSCGQMAGECDFWKLAAPRLKDNNTASVRDKYLVLFDCFNELYGNNRIMVDSSKWLSALKVLQSIDEIDLKIIYLVRDVRAWTISRLDKRASRPHIFKPDGNYTKRLEKNFGRKIKLIKYLVPWITKMPMYYFRIWYLQNRQIERYLKNNGLSYLQIGYDELGMNPAESMKIIFDYLGLEREGKDFSSTESQSHILTGNYRKSDPKRRQGIFYDNRWLYRNEWLRSAALFPGIMRYNAEQVYHNISKQTMWDWQNK